MGYGWDHSYNYRLDVQPLFYRLHLPNGNTYYYRIEDNGSLTIPEGAPPLQISSNSIEVTSNDNTIVFDREGNPLSVTNRIGDTVRFEAENGLITKIYNESGFFTLEYSDELLTKVTDSAGRSVSYVYDENENLTEFTNADGDRLKFTYDNNHNLLTAEDFNGNVYKESEYDDKHRVIRQTLPERGILTYT